jgi:hypothetical protein
MAGARAAAPVHRRGRGPAGSMSRRNDVLRLVYSNLAKEPQDQPRPVLVDAGVCQGTSSLVCAS